MASNILVLGAGELGISMLTALAAQKPANSTIAVLLRPSTITQNTSPALPLLRGLNIDFLPGDISLSISELAALFKPFDVVISCLGFTCGPGSQLKICNAVLQAKVKRFFPWQFGVDYDIIGRGSAQGLFDEQLDVRDILRGQGETEWVIVSTGVFTSFLFEPAFGVVDLKDGEGVVRALGSWENEVTVTSVEDVGKLVAGMVFEKGEGKLGNEVVFTAGETVSYAALAGVVDTVLGRKIRRELWSVEDLDGKDMMAMYRAVFAAGRGVAWGKDRSWNVRMRIEVEDVTGWMVRNIEKLRGE